MMTEKGQAQAARIAAARAAYAAHVTDNPPHTEDGKTDWIAAGAHITGCSDCRLASAFNRLQNDHAMLGWAIEALETGIPWPQNPTPLHTALWQIDGVIADLKSARERLVEGLGE
jgi:hypothetical protein